MPGYPSRYRGWNRQRLQRFLDMLAHTSRVKDAARVTWMSAVAGQNNASAVAWINAVTAAPALSSCQIDDLSESGKVNIHLARAGAGAADGDAGRVAAEECAFHGVIAGLLGADRDVLT